MSSWQYSGNHIGGINGVWLRGLRLMSPTEDKNELPGLRRICELKGQMYRGVNQAKPLAWTTPFTHKQTQHYSLQSHVCCAFFFLKLFLHLYQKENTVMIWACDKQIPVISHQQLLRQDQMETTRSFHLKTSPAWFQRDKDIVKTFGRRPGTNLQVSDWDHYCGDICVLKVLTGIPCH